jgi:hypothetical protein
MYTELDLIENKKMDEIIKKNIDFAANKHFFVFFGYFTDEKTGKCIFSLYLFKETATYF